MESGIQSSFIPQDAAKPKASPVRYSGGGLSDLGLLMAIVLLVASGALAAAVFLYGQYLDTSAASKLEQLQRAKEAFQPSLVQELTRLDDRMQAADQVLGAHIAPTAFFTALGQTTLQTVGFKTLDLDASDRQNMRIKMSGVAQSVNSIALQADLFTKSGTITNPIFSDINRQPDGVHFQLAALLNPSSVNYVQLLSGQAASAAIPQGQGVPQAQQPQLPASPFEAQPEGEGAAQGAQPQQ